MTSTVPLILNVEPVSAVDLRPRKARNPSVAIVYTTADGDAVLFDGGKPMTWSQQMFTRFRQRYEVDISDHRHTAQVSSTPLPARGDVDSFQTQLTVGFRVVDPVEIVRRRIQDGLSIVYGHIVDTCRPITRGFPIEEAALAEDALNARFRHGEALPEGIAIYMCRFQLSFDTETATFFKTGQRAGRASVTHDQLHQVQVGDVHREAEIEHMRQTTELQHRERERLALAGRPLTPEELVAIHLERNPQDTEGALVHLARIEQARQAGVDAERDRQREDFRFMVANDLVQAVDVGKVRDNAIAGMTQSPPPAINAGAWDDPLPTASAGGPLVPVYVVVDASAAVGAWLPEINAGIQQVYDGLLAAPDVAGVVRLSVFGYGDDVYPKPRLGEVAHGAVVPAISPHGQPHYAAAFDHLLRAVPRDARDLKDRYGRVVRPQVLFLSAGAPVDEASWPALYGQLVDRDRQDFAPDIVAFGVGTAAPTVIARVATRPELAFVSMGSDPGPAVTAFFEFVRRHVLDRGRAVLDGQTQLEAIDPQGFRRAG